MNGFQVVSPRQLAEELQHNATVSVIDVRTPVEYREVHLPEARNVPLDRLSEDTQLEEGGPLYVVCKSGGRASRACEELVKKGVDQLHLVEGGTDAWVAAGLPVERGKKAISLERQVRIAAGTLVLLGVVLGSLWHPVGFGLSAFVGAGLVFAGVTDTCGMGLMLSKMPWNNVSN